MSRLGIISQGKGKGYNNEKKSDFLGEAVAINIVVKIFIRGGGNKKYNFFFYFCFRSIFDFLQLIKEPNLMKFLKIIFYSA